MADEANGTAIGATQAKPKMGIWLLLVGAVIMLSGLLFGYDQGVIAGALGGIQKSFGASTTMIQIITSWVTLGALVGALVAGVLADKIGRRVTILLAAALFTVGALFEALAPNTTVLIIGRLIVGFGVGVGPQLRAGRCPHQSVLHAVAAATACHRQSLGCGCAGAAQERGVGLDGGGALGQANVSQLMPLDIQLEYVYP